MPTFQSILCPVDFSDQSRHALQWAVAFAARDNSRLIVFTAIEPLLAEAARAKFGLDLRSAEAVPALRAVVASVVPAGAAWSPTIEIEAGIGDAAGAIVEAAGRHRVDLVVMGTQGVGGVQKMLVGSTTERVLRRSRTPVFAVPADAPHIAAAADGPRLPSGPILVATDFSTAANVAVACGVKLAATLDAELILLHVVQPIAVASEWVRFVEGTDDESVRRAQQRLEELASSLRLTSSEHVVRVGRPADVIAAVAGQRAAAMILMGLTGEHGSLSPHPGAIAYRVLSQADRPVLVVPPAEGV